MLLGCAIVALSMMACGEQEVGLACSAMTPCPSQLMCAADLPDGYCTESCDTPGFSCGSGGIAAYCAQNGGVLRCSVVCIGNDDCRPGYSCEDAPGTYDPSTGPLNRPYKVCVAQLLM